MAPGPDPAGPMPADWKNPERWPAFVALSHGSSLTEAGRLVGRKRGTVSGWVTQWRAQYGEGTLREGRKRPTYSEASTALGIRLGASATAAKWRDIREASASRFGLLSDAALAAALLVIEENVNDPERRAKLTVDDARTLAVVADMAARRADALADVVDPTKAAQWQTGGAGPQVPGLFDGLDAIPAGAAGGEVIEMIEIVTGRIRRQIEVEDGRGDVVDVDERVAG